MGDLPSRLNDFISKLATRYGNRMYLRPGEYPPSGQRVFTGAQGGRYYLINEGAEGSYTRLSPEKQAKVSQAVQRLKGELFPQDMYEESELTQDQKNFIAPFPKYTNKDSEGEIVSWDVRFPNGRKLVVFND